MDSPHDVPLDEPAEAGGRTAARGILRTWQGRLFRLAGWLVALSVAWTLVYRIVPPPVTPLMLIRAYAGLPMTRRWVPLERIAPALQDAVIASEDTSFCSHYGFDWGAIAAAWRVDQEGGRLLGASTISMQTARNAFLWPSRTWLRKLTEAWFTVLIETFWSKRRILEVYLNIIEWGRGLYGADAAARAYFHRPAADLTPRQAALLAVTLPDPWRWSPARPSSYVGRRAGIIERRMAIVRHEGLDACIR